MKLRIVTVSNRAPQWIQQGYGEYARRLPREISLELVEVKPESRPDGSPGDKEVRQLKIAEAARIRPFLEGFHTVVALDERGMACSTAGLADLIRSWQLEGENTAFVIGGADGLDEDLKRMARLRMSLSAMTLPHQLVRVMLAEQIYRAVSVIKNHPYHRA